VRQLPSCIQTPRAEARGRKKVHWNRIEVDSDDMQFIEAVAIWATEHACIDRSRIFAVGFSAGGWVVNALGCIRPDLFRGVVPIAAAGPFTSCNVPMAAMVMNGRHDHSASVTMGWRSANSWRAVNSCANSTATWPNGPCYKFDNCDPNAPVLWCEYPGGHDWPAFATRANPRLGRAIRITTFTAMITGADPLWIVAT